MICTTLTMIVALVARQIPEKIFVRDQPTLHSMVPWRGNWAVQADRLYLVDARRISAVVLEHPAVETVLDVHDSGDRGLLFGIQAGKAKLLSLVNNNAPVEIPLPIEISRSPLAWHLVAAVSGVVFVKANGAFACDLPTCRWRSVEVKKALWEGESRSDAPGVKLLHHDKLFLAIDQGEFGGGLISLDLHSGATSLIENDSDPATGLAEDTKGRVWATWGLAHMGSDRGTLRVLDRGHWRLVARISNYQRDKTKNWPFSPTSFESVTVRDDRVLILTSHLGIVELAGNLWKRLTPGWEEHQYVHALGLSDNTAVVGTYDAGVVLWKLGSSQAQRVSFPSREKLQH